MVGEFEGVRIPPLQGLKLPQAVYVLPCSKSLGNSPAQLRSNPTMPGAGRGYASTRSKSRGIACVPPVCIAHQTAASMHYLDMMHSVMVLLAYTYCGKKRASSMRQSAWYTGKCNSWTLNVSDSGTWIHTSHNAVKAPPSCPVSPSVCIPFARATLNA